MNEDESSWKSICSNSPDESAVRLHGHGGKRAVRDGVVEDIAAAVIPVGVVQRSKMSKVPLILDQI